MFFLDRLCQLGQPPRVPDDLRDPESSEPTYSLGAVARLTGLSPHVLRAWERRYGAVAPLRTPGGTRRYRETDVARLRKLRAAVMAGHAISEVAQAADAELDHRLQMAPEAPRPAIAPLMDAIEELDGPALERLLGTQLAALGPRQFVQLVVAPFLHEIGARWEAGSLCIASEHLASAILRNLLGAALRTTSAGLRAPPVLFTTLPGEQHELGSLMAAVAAADCGGRPIFVGGNLPLQEIVDAAASLGAAAVAVGVSRVNGGDLAATLEALRKALPARTELWIGGPGVASLCLPPSAHAIADLDELERKLALLAVRAPS